MTPTLRRRLLQAGSFALAVGLLVLALYGVDLFRIGEAFREADYRWLALLVVLIVGSNLLRAWRWQILIDALPSTSRPDGAATMSRGRMLEAAFSSVMIGYMVNNAAPRMGEVARTANLAARTEFRFSSLFGTVVSERIFDMFILGLALLSAVLLLFNRLGVLQEQFLVPVLAGLPSVSSVWLAGGAIAVLLLVVGGVILIRRRLRRETSVLGVYWRETVRPALVSFREGLLTLIRSPHRWGIALSTLGMWVGYLLMAYIPFRMLHLAEPYGISVLDAWILMAIGAIGMVVPSPGGIGSYHYITIQALVYLYEMPKAPAATYAVLTNGVQIIFYTLAGGLVILYQGSSLRPSLSFRSDSTDSNDSDTEA